MARKKNPTAARKQEEIEPQTKSHHHTGDQSPPAAAAALEKIGNLKTLNNLLLKETMERREQVSHLNSLVEDLSVDHAILSSIERDVGRLVLSSRLADEAEAREAAARRMETDLLAVATDKAAGVEERVRSLQATVDLVSEALRSAEERLEMVMGEKDEIKKALDHAVYDRDDSLLDLGLKSKEVEHLRAMVQEMERKLEEILRSKKEVVESLMAEREADAAKLSALESEHRGIALTKDRLEAELGGSKDAFDSLKKEEEGLQSEVAELEERNAKVLEELERLRVDFGMLKIEKEEEETCFYDQMKENTQLLDELKEGMEEIKAQKDEIERARATQEVEIAGLQKRVEQLQSTVSNLQGVCKDQAKENGLLRADLELERGEAEGLRFQVGELEKSKDSVKEELEGLRVDVALLKKEKEEGETHFKDQAKETTQLLDGLRRKMSDIAVQKDEIKRARAEQEVQNAELQKEVQQLQSTVSALERACKDQAEANAMLRADKEAAQRELDLERGEADGLRFQIGELENSNNRVEEELERLCINLARLKKEKEEAEKVVEQLCSNVSDLEGACRDHAAIRRDLDAEREEAGRLRLQLRELKKSKDGITEDLGRLKTEDEERKRQLISLTEEKASLERSLTATQHELDETTRKMKDVEMNSERALSLLRSTAGVMLDAEGSKENSVVREVGCVAGMMGEELQPFASELEAIKAAFASRAGKIEDLNREVGLLQGAVAEAQKRKVGFWAWFYPATTTVALAAISVAYATKGN